MKTAAQNKPSLGRSEQLLGRKGPGAPGAPPFLDVYVREEWPQVSVKLITGIFHEFTVLLDIPTENEAAGSCCLWHKSPGFSALALQLSRKHLQGLSWGLSHPQISLRANLYWNPFLNSVNFLHLTYILMVCSLSLPVAQILEMLWKNIAVEAENAYIKSI